MFVPQVSLSWRLTFDPSLLRLQFLICDQIVIWYATTVYSRLRMVRIALWTVAVADVGALYISARYYKAVESYS
jgi:hypothetical protein